MKTRNLILLLLLLAVAAGGTFLVVRHGESNRAARVENTPLFERLPINEVASIEIRSSRGQATCVKKDGRWVVPDRLDYPADFTKVTALLRRLNEARTLRAFEANDETLRRLGLKAPEAADAQGEEKGLRVVLGDGKGEELARLIINAPRGPSSGTPAPAGRYTRLGDENLVRVLMDEQKFFAWSANPVDWMERVIVRTPPDEVRRITCTASGTGELVYALSRPTREDDLVSELPLPGEISPLRLNQVAGGISPLGAEDVVRNDPAPPTPEAFPFHIDYELFDGRVIRVHTSQGSAAAEPFTVRVEQFAPGASASDPTTPRGEVARWVFKLPVPKHIAFIVKADELLHKPSGGTPPQTP